MPSTRKPVRLASLRELDYTLASLRTDFIKQCVYATCISLFVPVIATLMLLAAPFYRYWPERAKTMRKLVYISVLAFVVCFGLPLFCIMEHTGGFRAFTAAVEAHDLSTVEVYSPFLAYFLIQYFIVFVLHVSLTVERVVDDAKHVRRRQCEQVFFESPSTTIDRALTGASSRSVKVPLSTIISDLEGLPGWSRLEGYDPTIPAASTPPDSARPQKIRRQVSKTSDEQPDYQTFAPEQSDYHSTSDLLIRHQSLFSEDDAKDAWEKLNTTLILFMRKQVEHITANRSLTMWLLLICMLRATLSRVWIFSYWDHPILPHDGLLCLFSVHSILVTFVATGIWVILFVNAVIAYSTNRLELNLVSALVTVQSRHVYISQVLLPEADGDVHIFNKWCRSLPHISMGHVENIKAWWMIREYALVDTMDERTTLEIVIFMGMMSIILMTLQCLYDLYLAGTLASSQVAMAVTSFQVQAVVDIVLIGYLVCVAMLRMLAVNDILADQGQLLLQARHYLLLPQASLMSLSEAEVKSAMEADDGQGESSILRTIPKSSILAADFLTHLNEVIRYDDFIQSLFGVEVTSFNVAQVVLAMITGLGSAFGGLYVLYKERHGELTFDAPGPQPTPKPEEASAIGAALVSLGSQRARAAARALRGN